jgi:hypothetical protein
VNRARRGRVLANAFVVAKDERLILDDGGAAGSTELNAVKSGDFWPIEEIARVKNAIAIKDVGGAVKLVCARFSNGVDDGTRGPTVSSGVITVRTVLLTASTPRLTPRGAARCGA